MRKEPHHGWRATRLGVFLATAACGLACEAGVTTIHEGGPTVPIGHYLAAFFTQEPGPVPSATPAPTGALPLAFPVRTALMRPGRLHSPVTLPGGAWLTTPMFIVGDDAQSRQWLAIHREKLRRLGASGLVVNVATLEAFQSLRAVAPAVPMAPGSAEELAQHTRLSVYPLFVSTDGQISQRVP
jgi:integrating conjugative element protein (TIGR03765 family)